MNLSPKILGANNSQKCEAAVTFRRTVEGENPGNYASLCLGQGYSWRIEWLRLLASSGRERRQWRGKLFVETSIRYSFSFVAFKTVCRID